MKKIVRSTIVILMIAITIATITAIKTNKEAKQAKEEYEYLADSLNQIRVLHTKEIKKLNDTIEARNVIISDLKAAEEELEKDKKNIITYYNRKIKEIDKLSDSEIFKLLASRYNTTSTNTIFRETAKDIERLNSCNEQRDIDTERINKLKAQVSLQDSTITDLGNIISRQEKMLDTYVVQINKLEKLTEIQEEAIRKHKRNTRLAVGGAAVIGILGIIF